MLSEIVRLPCKPSRSGLPWSRRVVATWMIFHAPVDLNRDAWCGVKLVMRWDGSFTAYEWPSTVMWTNCSSDRPFLSECSQDSDREVGKEVFAKWVPHLLTDDQRATRLQWSRQHLRRFRREGEDFLTRIMTCDETWVFSWDPKLKRQCWMARWRITKTRKSKKETRRIEGDAHCFLRHVRHHFVMACSFRHNSEWCLLPLSLEGETSNGDLQEATELGSSRSLFPSWQCSGTLQARSSRTLGLLGLGNSLTSLAPPIWCHTTFSYSREWRNLSEALNLNLWTILFTRPRLLWTTWSNMNFWMPLKGSCAVGRSVLLMNARMLNKDILSCIRGKFRDFYFRTLLTRDKGNLLSECTSYMADVDDKRYACLIGPIVIVWIGSKNKV